MIPLSNTPPGPPFLSPPFLSSNAQDLAPSIELAKAKAPSTPKSVVY
jgi:hypothetical protein